MSFGGHLRALREQAGLSRAELARRAGVPLDDLMLAQLLEGAPYALDMVRRLRRDHDPHHEPANVFSFPAANH